MLGKPLGSIIVVDAQSGVEAALLLRAWRLERRLGDCVVLLVEGEDDLVTRDCVLYFRVNIRAFRVFEAINSRWLLG